jgi:hypothetical protein
MNCGQDGEQHAMWITVNYYLRQQQRYQCR